MSVLASCFGATIKWREPVYGTYTYTVMNRRDRAEHAFALLCSCAAGARGLGLAKLNGRRHTLTSFFRLREAMACAIAFQWVSCVCVSISFSLLLLLSLSKAQCNMVKNYFCFISAHMVKILFVSQTNAGRPPTW